MTHYKQTGYFCISLVIIATLLITGCRTEPKTDTKPPKKDIAPLIQDVKTGKDTLALKEEEIENKPAPSEKADIGNWTELTKGEGFVLDIRYATTNNFTKKRIYDCGKCYLRPEAAEKLKVINEELKEKFGYGIKIFDCYRPRPYQQRLWDIVPNPDYVTPPHKGSMHSRGLAIDLTLVDKDGKELDMGTPFDFFGKEAHQGYPDLSDAVKRHRWILKSTMQKHGFGSIRTEWWHYSYNGKTYQLDEWVWKCD